MAVQNSLTKTRPQEKKPVTVTYKAGNAEVTLSLGMIKKYLVTGSPENVTEQELMMFMSLCRYQGLNPFLRDAYLIKYGNQPATIVTGKGALEKRAARCERYRGFESGIIVLTADGNLEHRTGAFYLPTDTLVGGWARAFVDGFEQPVEAAVSIEEYLGKKKDGTINSQWATKPATMIRKVAKMQALREAFPEDMQGMYEAEEIGIADLDETPVQQPEQEVTPPLQTVIETAAEPADDFADLMQG